MFSSEKETCIGPSPRNRTVQAGAIAMKPQSSKTIYFIGDAGSMNACANLDYHMLNLGSHSDLTQKVVQFAAKTVRASRRDSRPRLSVPVRHALHDLQLHTYRRSACSRGICTPSTSRLNDSTFREGPQTAGQVK